MPKKDYEEEERREQYRKEYNDFLEEIEKSEEKRSEAVFLSESYWETLSDQEKIVWFDGLGFGLSILQEVLKHTKSKEIANEVGAMLKMRGDEIRGALASREFLILREAIIPFFSL